MIEKLLNLLERLVTAQERLAASHESWIDFRRNEVDTEQPQEVVTETAPATAEPVTIDVPPAAEEPTAPADGPCDPNDRSEIRRQLDEIIGADGYNNRLSTPKLYDLLVKNLAYKEEHGAAGPEPAAAEPVEYPEATKEELRDKITETIKHDSGDKTKVKEIVVGIATTGNLSKIDPKLFGQIVYALDQYMSAGAGDEGDNGEEGDLWD